MSSTKSAKCPLPLVKSRKAIVDLGVGQVLRVIATDRGSLADFQGWVRAAKNVELVAQETRTQALEQATPSVS